ncbi:hypothetical protein [Flavilitoribacter nigricans]|uniref:Uncharacterized protein n=1 Tax=Flavilitoribacter nigricans (strain ATCC 23147 / DSM 23189 / NBRC 102662 / NCIMB 1420 / SS-2) TaxID=1122177 RepID=A0A2D0NFY8_FLAN2|nr:hypothetical protein [Flavilitoribacter nigricans]PHN06693.1 hypothetical protein CRP01_10375 [Flavilitoribacter nigricans DSM 23189 = NBRC 102662]
MKKSFLILSTLLLIFGGLTASAFHLSESADASAAVSPYSAYSLIGSIVSKYDAKRGIATVKIADVKSGKNVIATDLRKNRRLFMVAEKSSTGQVKVEGFMIMDASGKFSRLGNPFRSKGGDEFGCPAGWDATIVCYTHPIYNVQVCYTRCTPTEITLQLPGGGL